MDWPTLSCASSVASKARYRLRINVAGSNASTTCQLVCIRPRNKIRVNGSYFVRGWKSSHKTFHSQVQKCTFSQPFKEKCISVVVRTGSIIIFHLSKLWNSQVLHSVWFNISGEAAGDNALGHCLRLQNRWSQFSRAVKRRCNPDRVVTGPIRSSYFCITGKKVQVVPHLSFLVSAQLKVFTPWPLQGNLLSVCEYRNVFSSPLND